VEAAGAEAGQPGEQLSGRVVGQDAQRVRIGEGDMAEVHGAQIGPCLGQHPPEEREVIVLHQHGRVRRRVRAHGVGHGLVVAAIGVPRLPPVPVESGPAGQIEEMVMAIPERRVGHDVVGGPVRLVVDDDREQREVLLGHPALGDGGAICRAHRHRGPGRPRAGQERPDGRDQAATAGDRVQRAIVIEAERERAAIGDDKH